MMAAANASIGFASERERDRIGFFGRIGGNAHRGDEERERLNFGAGLAWDRSISSRSSSNLSLGVDRGFRAETLSDLGVLAPGADTFSTNAAWTFQHQLTPRTGLSTSLRYHYQRIESDEPIPGSQLVTDEPPFIEDFPPISPDAPGDGPIPVPDVEDDIVDIIATEGLLANRTDSHFANAGFGVSHRLSEYSTFGFDMAGGYRTTESAKVDGELDSRDGAQSAVRFWAQKRIGQFANVGTSYQVSRSVVIEPATTIHTLVGSYGYSPGTGRISFSFSGGASHYQAESGPSRTTPVINASFTSALTRTTRFAVAYRRQFSQSIGFGRTLLIDYAYANFRQELGSRVDLTLRAGGTFASDPLQADSTQDAVQYGGTLNWRVLESLRVGTGVFNVRRRHGVSTDLTESDRTLWTVYATYTARWH